MTDRYKQFRKHNVEIFERLEKYFNDMIEYDERLIVFTPFGRLLASLSSDKEIEELRKVLDEYDAKYLPQFKKEIEQILEE